MKKPGLHTKEVFRFVINLIFALYNGMLGLVSHSWWFITVGAYYIILSIMRILVIGFGVKNREQGTFVMRFTGCMLFVLAVVLCGMVYMTIQYDVATGYHEIVMITIALYAFTKFTLAITRLVKSRKNDGPYHRTLRSISFTDAVVSIYSLQRSMLATFEGLTPEEIVLLNTLSGIGMCCIVIFIGIYLIIGGKKTWQNQRL